MITNAFENVLNGAHSELDTSLVAGMLTEAALNMRLLLTITLSINMRDGKGRLTSPPAHALPAWYMTDESDSLPVIMSAEQRARERSQLSLEQWKAKAAQAFPAELNIKKAPAKPEKVLTPFVSRRIPTE